MIEESEVHLNDKRLGKKRTHLALKIWRKGEQPILTRFPPEIFGGFIDFFIGLFDFALKRL